MRLSSSILTFGVFAAASVLAIGSAYLSSRVVEKASIAGVRKELDREAMNWATVDANGLQVFLAGDSPDEAVRFRAVTAAGRAVDTARIIDQMTVAEGAALAKPRFSVELLRNDSGVSIHGLVPVASDVEALVSDVQDAVGRDVPVSNFLETADFEPPEYWDDALYFAIANLDDLVRSQISVEAGAVRIRATSPDRAAKRKLEADLTRRAPENVSLTLSLTAPRPVISPFTMRFVADDSGAVFDACSAPDEDSRQTILQAASEAGLDGQANCRIGLGVPSPRWAEAIQMGLGAVAELGGGTLTFTDTDVSLIALDGTDQGTFDRITGQFENDLPSAFALTAVLPDTPEEGEVGPIEFVATLSPEGSVQLRGNLSSDLAVVTTESYAQARFGSGVVRMAAHATEDLPTNWSHRVLAGLDALSSLSNGAMIVTADSVKLSGNTGEQNARAALSGLLSEKLGKGEEFDIDVQYLERLDPTLAIPTPEECVAKIVEIIGDRKITFEPSSATLDESAKDIMDEIAELLKICGDIPLEIQGHTDSQGREIMNQELSQARAESVLDALRQRRVLTSAYDATGYGEANPIADNETEEGREANRRIEFRLIKPEPVVEEQTTLETIQDAGDAIVEGSDTPAPDDQEDKSNE